MFLVSTLRLRSCPGDVCSGTHLTIRSHPRVSGCGFFALPFGAVWAAQVCVCESRTNLVPLWFPPERSVRDRIVFFNIMDQILGTSPP